FGVYELHVGEAEKREYRFQIRNLRVGGRVAVLAAAGERHVDFLALEQAFWTLLGVAERHTGTRNRVDPVLELRRHAKVVHRDAQYHDIGRLDLGDQGVIERHARSLLGRALTGRREQRTERGFIEHRVRRVVEVAHREGRF